MVRLKMQPIAHPLLKFFNRPIVKFDCPPALDADEMVVVLVPGDMFIRFLQFAQFQSVNQTALDQQIKCPINARARDILPVLLQDLHQFIRIEMAMGGKNGLEYLLSLGRKLQIFPQEEFSKRFVFQGHKIISSLI
jgi:hypothetical protein